MEDGQDVRAALGGLALHAEPPAGFDADDVVRAGRRTRRRRGFLAAGGASLAVAAVVTATVLLPGSGSGHDRGGERTGGGSTATAATPSAKSTAVPSTKATAKPSGKVTTPPGNGTGTPGRCEPSTPQWNVHLAYQAKLSGLLPPVTGTVVDALSRVGFCSDPKGDFRLALMTVTVGRAVGRIDAGTGVFPGQYQMWLHGDGLCTPAPPHGTCTLIRHGNVLVWTLTRPKGYSQGAGDQIMVQAMWPDDTSVTVSAATQYDNDHPALGSVPLTRAQLLAIAMAPGLRQ